MTFGFNSFNMLNMLPMMNFNSFGMNSFGFNSFGSSLLPGGSLFGYGCGGFSATPNTCANKAYWGTIGFGLATTFAPMLTALIGKGIQSAKENSNSSQQANFSDNIETLEAKKTEITENAGMDESAILNYKEETTSPAITTAQSAYETAKANSADLKNKIENNKVIIDNYEKNKTNTEKRIAELETKDPLSDPEKEELKKLQDNKKAYNSAVDQNKVYEEKLEEAKAKEELAKEELEKAQADLKAKNERILNAQEEIKNINKEIQKAQEELNKLILDKADGTKLTRTNAENFAKLIKKDPNGSYGFVDGKDASDVTKGDLQHILAQYNKATDENEKKKWGQLFLDIYDDSKLNVNIKTSTYDDAYKLVKKEINN